MPDRMNISLLAGYVHLGVTVSSMEQGSSSGMITTDQALSDGKQVGNRNDSGG